MVFLVELLISSCEEEEIKDEVGPQEDKSKTAASTSSLLILGRFIATCYSEQFLFHRGKEDFDYNSAKIESFNGDLEVF